VSKTENCMRNTKFIALALAASAVSGMFVAKAQTYGSFVLPEGV
jgi:hypothetical protein